MGSGYVAQTEPGNLKLELEMSSFSQLAYYKIYKFDLLFQQPFTVVYGKKQRKPVYSKSESMKRNRDENSDKRYLVY